MPKVSKLSSAKYIVLIAIFFTGAISFVKNTFEIMASNRRYETLENEVKSLDAQKVTLENDLEYVQSVEYIEKEARNKLNLVKSGETVYVVDAEFASNLGLDDVLGDSIAFDGNLNAEAQSSKWANLRLWADLVFDIL